jgi:flagellar basal-body rod protein FlgB
MSDFIGKDNTYGLLKNALSASYIRQETLSNNIANVNTPNYKANRVIFEEELKKAISKSHIGMQATHQNHIGGNVAQEIQAKIIKDKSTTMRNDGNNVDIDLEMANLAANQLLYNTLIQQTNSKISTLRYVINEGRR